MTRVRVEPIYSSLTLMDGGGPFRLMGKSLNIQPVRDARKAPSASIPILPRSCRRDSMRSSLAAQPWHSGQRILIARRRDESGLHRVTIAAPHALCVHVRPALDPGESSRRLARDLPGPVGNLHAGAARARFPIHAEILQAAAGVGRSVPGGVAGRGNFVVAAGRLGGGGVAVSIE